MDDQGSISWLNLVDIQIIRVSKPPDNVVAAQLKKWILENGGVEQGKSSQTK